MWYTGKNISFEVCAYLAICVATGKTPKLSGTHFPQLQNERFRLDDL